MPRLEPNLSYTYLDSPIGRLLLAGDGSDNRLHRILFPNEQAKADPPGGWRRDDTLFADAVDQIRAYFSGALTRFDLRLHFAGTDFQNAVWSALCSIPFGQTVSYGALAARIGRPTASRAVGAANGANPLPVVVPCHRVIGADKSLTGFGGGIDTKRYLLAHEQRLSVPEAAQRQLSV